MNQDEPKQKKMYCYTRSENFYNNALFENTEESIQQIKLAIDNNHHFSTTFCNLITHSDNIELQKLFITKYIYAIQILSESVRDLVIPVIELVKKNNYQIYQTHICEYLALYGRFDMLKHSVTNDKCVIDHDVCIAAVKSGQLPILQWLVENGATLDRNITSIAAEYGYLHILKWIIISNNGQWSFWTCSEAAKNGHLHIIVWAINNGCAFNEFVFIHAAQKGHLHILEWLKEKKNQLPISTSISVYATNNGNLHILKWLHENNCPIDKSVCRVIAKQKHFSDILHWIATI